MTPADPTLHEEEDLFNFDELLRSPSKVEPAASAAAPAPAPSPAPATPRAQVLAPKPAAASAPPTIVNTPGQLPLVRPVAPTGPAPLSPQAAALSAMLEPQPRRVGALTLATLGIATLVNLALVGVVWRSMSGMGSALREVGDQVARASETSTEAPRTSPQEVQQLAVPAPTSLEGEQALDAAAHDLSLGDFEHCRARLYSLLTVIDRFDAKLRSSLSSRAQVMIADSYREQANRVEREALARSGESGFLSLPVEPHR